MATWKDVDPDDVQIVEDAGESAKSLQRPGLNLLASVSQWDQSISPRVLLAHSTSKGSHSSSAPKR